MDTTTQAEPPRADTWATRFRLRREAEQAEGATTGARFNSSL